MSHHESLVDHDGTSSAFTAWSVICGLAVVAVAMVVVTSIPDIKRYIRISTM